MKINIYWLGLAFYVIIGSECVDVINRTCETTSEGCLHPKSYLAQVRSEPYCFQHDCDSDANCCDYTICKTSSSDVDGKCMCKNGQRPHDQSCYEEKLCQSDEDCREIPGSICKEHIMCTCGKEYYQRHEVNKALASCTKYTECKQSADCQGLYQECRGGYCRCINLSSPPGAEYDYNCIANSCKNNSECADYEECAQNQTCQCVYGTSTENSIPTCQKNKKCASTENCSDIPRSVCLLGEEVCNCSGEYNQRNEDYNHVLLNCTKYHDCVIDDDCPVYQECQNTKCRCKDSTSLPESEYNDTCVITSCNVNSDCGSYEECNISSSTCQCKNGLTDEKGIIKCKAYKNCTLTEDCSEMPRSVCVQKEGECKCSGKYDQQNVDDNRNLVNCTKYKECTSFSDCPVNQECRNKKCRCRDFTSSPEAEYNNTCVTPSCKVDEDCDWYEQCNTTRKECQCKNELTEEKGFPQCQDLRSCNDDQDCSDILRSTCVRNSCWCKPPFNTPNYDANQNLANCTNYLWCFGSCDGWNQECLNQQCRCRNQLSAPEAEYNNTCLGSPCKTTRRCESYEECSKETHSCECVLGFEDGTNDECKADKPCNSTNECSEYPRSVCRSNICTCLGEYNQRHEDNRDILINCTKYQTCKENSNCPMHQSCPTDQCRCRMSTSQPEAEYNYTCIPPSCHKKSDCWHYEVCNHLSKTCKCKYGEIGESPGNTCKSIECQSDEQCSNSKPNSWCYVHECKCRGGFYPKFDSADILLECVECLNDTQCPANALCKKKCSCQDGYHTIRNYEGKIEECYRVACSGLNDTCGVYENCQSNICKCMFGEDTSKEKIPCLGRKCSALSGCGDEQKCNGIGFDSRCECSRGMFRFPNKTFACKSNYNCLESSDCGRGAGCSNTNICECYNKNYEPDDKEDNGRLTCSLVTPPPYQNKSSSSNVIIFAIVGVIVCLLFIMGCGILFRRKRLQEQQRDANLNSRTPLPISTNHLIDRQPGIEPSVNTEASAPPASHYPPPTYEEAVTQTTTPI